MKVLESFGITAKLLLCTHDQIRPIGIKRMWENDNTFMHCWTAKMDIGSASRFREDTRRKRKWDSRKEAGLHATGFGVV